MDRLGHYNACEDLWAIGERFDRWLEATLAVRFTDLELRAESLAGAVAVPSIDRLRRFARWRRHCRHHRCWSGRRIAARRMDHAMTGSLDKLIGLTFILMAVVRRLPPAFNKPEPQPSRNWLSSLTIPGRFKPLGLFWPQGRSLCGTPERRTGLRQFDRCSNKARLAWGCRAQKCVAISRSLLDTKSGRVRAH